jgi:TRAP-type C4-dicarboxylate transport system permease large subunit
MLKISDGMDDFALMTIPVFMLAGAITVGGRGGWRWRW